MINKKLIEGIVKCNKHALNGTLFIEVTRQKYDKFFSKNIQSKKIYTVHYESRKPIENGTKIVMSSCRPISKRKSHKIEEVR